MRTDLCRQFLEATSLRTLLTNLEQVSEIVKVCGWLIIDLACILVHPEALERPKRLPTSRQTVVWALSG